MGSQDLAEKILAQESEDIGVSDLGVSSVEKPFYFVDNPKKESVYIGLIYEILQNELDAQYFLLSLIHIASCRRIHQ